MYVVYRTVGGRCGARLSTCLDDHSSTLLHRRYEILPHPVFINEFRRRSTADRRVSEIWILGSRVIAPDRHPFYFCNFGIRLFG